MTRPLLAAALLLTCGFPCMAQESASRLPSNGVVADEATALKIAAAVGAAVYGDGVISQEEPLVAHLVDGVWQVHGSMPKGAFGGVISIEISKSDGRIISIVHGK